MSIKFLSFNKWISRHPELLDGTDETGVTGTIECEKCEGSGTIHCTCDECGDEHEKDCDVCDGNGFVKADPVKHKEKLREVRMKKAMQEYQKQLAHDMKLAKEVGLI
jgi:hypothetical protein